MRVCRGVRRFKKDGSVWTGDLNSCVNAAASQKKSKRAKTQEVSEKGSKGRGGCGVREGARG